MMYFFVALIMTISCKEKTNIAPDIVPEADSALKVSDGNAIIAKWKDNKKAALTINFDDATPGQATLAIPALNAKGIKGTFYINPGTSSYAQNKNTWEIIAPANGHELANHTMNHRGATTYAQTLFEVGEASKVIWRIRGHQDCGSLIAFNRGGGTTWNEADLANVLIQFCNFDRQTTIGEQYKALSVVAGSNATEMYKLVPIILAGGMLGRYHFHGIAANDGNPPKDWGYAGVWIEDFKSFLNMLTSVQSQLWITTFSEAFKYVKERRSTTLIINKTGIDKYILTLNCTLDKKYYNQALTVIVTVPTTWSSCEVTYNGSKATYPVKSGKVMFDAKPNYGQLIITKI